MRYIVALLLILVVVLYFTMGLRFGYLTLSTTYMFNASGRNNYSYSTVEDGQKAGITGECKVNSGQATLRLLDSRGVQVAGQTCRPGRWSINLFSPGGQPAAYRLEVVLKKYSGSMRLNPELKGRW